MSSAVDRLFESAIDEVAGAKDRKSKDAIVTGVVQKQKVEIADLSFSVYKAGTDTVMYIAGQLNEAREALANGTGSQKAVDVIERILESLGVTLDGVNVKQH